MRVSISLAMGWLFLADHRYFKRLLVNTVMISVAYKKKYQVLDQSGNVYKSINLFTYFIDIFYGHDSW